MSPCILPFICIFTTQGGDCHEVIAEAVMVTRSKGLVNSLRYIGYGGVYLVCIALHCLIV